jgi:integrase/recombinase XerD
MATTSTSTAVAVAESVFTEPERRALAGFLAGYRPDPRSVHAGPAPVRQLVPAASGAAVPGSPRRHRVLRPDLEARGRARATITRRLCTIAGFYKYAVEEEFLDHSPAAHVRRPRLDYESTATGLDRNEMGALRTKG